MWSYETDVPVTGGRTTLVPSGHSIRKNSPFRWCRIRMASWSLENLDIGFSSGNKHAETYTKEPRGLQSTFDARVRVFRASSPSKTSKLPPTCRSSQSLLLRRARPTCLAGKRSPVIRQIA